MPVLAKTAIRELSAREKRYQKRYNMPAGEGLEGVPSKEKQARVTEKSKAERRIRKIHTRRLKNDRNDRNDRNDVNMAEDESIQQTGSQAPLDNSIKSLSTQNDPLGKRENQITGSKRTQGEPVHEDHNVLAPIETRRRTRAGRVGANAQNALSPGNLALMPESQGVESTMRDANSATEEGAHSSARETMLEYDACLRGLRQDCRNLTGEDRDEVIRISMHLAKRQFDLYYLGLLRLFLRLFLHQTPEEVKQRLPSTMRQALGYLIEEAWKGEESRSTYQVSQEFPEIGEESQRKCLIQWYQLFKGLDVAINNQTTYKHIIEAVPPVEIPDNLDSLTPDEMKAQFLDVFSAEGSLVGSRRSQMAGFRDIVERDIDWVHSIIGDIESSRGPKRADEHIAGHTAHPESQGEAEEIMEILSRGGNDDQSNSLDVLALKRQMERKELLKLQEKVQQINEELESSRECVETLKSTVSKQDKQLKDSGNNYESLQQRFTKGQQKIRELQQKADAANGEVEIKQEEVKNIKKKIDELEDANKAKENKLAEIAATLQGKDRRIEELEELEDQLKGLKKSHSEEILRLDATYTAKLTECEKNAGERLERVREKNKLAQQEFNKTIEGLEEKLSARNRAFEEKKATLEETETKLLGKLSELGILNESLKRKETMITELEEQLAEEKSVKDNNARDFEKNLEEERKSRRNAEVSIKRLEAQQMAREKELKTLTDKLKEASIERERAEASTKKLEDEKSVSESHTRAIEKKVQGEEAARKKAEASMERLEEEMATREKEVKTLKERLEEQETARKKAEDSKSRLEEENAAREKNIEVLKEASKEQESRIKSLEEEATITAAALSQDAEKVRKKLEDEVTARQKAEALVKELEDEKRVRGKRLEASEQELGDEKAARQKAEALAKKLEAEKAAMEQETKALAKKLEAEETARAKAETFRKEAEEEEMAREKRIKALEKRLEEVEAARKEAENSRNKLEEERTAEKTKIEGLKKTIRELESRETSKQEEALAVFNKKLDQAKTAREKVEVSVQELEQETTASKQKAEALAKELEEERMSRERTEALMKILEKEKTTKEKEAEAIRKELEDERKARHDAEASAKKLEEEKATREKEATALKEKLEEVQRMQKKVKVPEKGMERDDREEESGSLENKLKREMDKMSFLNEKSTNMLNEMSNNLTGGDAGRREAEVLSKELEEAKTARTAAENTKKELERKTILLENEIHALKRTVLEEKAARANAESSAKELEEARIARATAEISKKELEKEITVRDKEIQALQKRLLEEEKEAQANAESSKKELEEVRAARETAETSKTELEREISVRDKEIQALRKRLLEEKAARANAETSKEKLEREITVRVKEIQALGERLLEEKEARANAETSTKDIEQIATRRAESIRVLEQQLQNLTSSLSAKDNENTVKAVNLLSQEFTRNIGVLAQEIEWMRRGLEDMRPITFQPCDPQQVKGGKVPMFYETRNALGRLPSPTANDPMLEKATFKTLTSAHPADNDVHTPRSSREHTLQFCDAIHQSPSSLETSEADIMYGGQRWTITDIGARGDRYIILSDPTGAHKEKQIAFVSLFKGCGPSEARKNRRKVVTFFRKKRLQLAELFYVGIISVVKPKKGSGLSFEVLFGGDLVVKVVARSTLMRWGDDVVEDIEQAEKEEQT